MLSNPQPSGPKPTASHEVALDFRSTVEGYFTVTLLDAEAFRERGEEVVRRRLRFHNLITNAGMNRVANMNTGTDLEECALYCRVGTGATAPAVTDTALVAQVGETFSNAGFADVTAAGPAGGGPGLGPEYWYRTRTRVFLEGEANGNLTEVGMAEGTAGSAGTLWTRQLFLDEFSAPTTIVKTSAELLKIEYEQRMYVPTAVVLQSGVSIGGVLTDVRIHPIRVDTVPWSDMLRYGSNGLIATGVTGYSAWAYEADADLSLDFKSNPSTASAVGSSTKAFDTVYVADSYQAKITYTWDLAVANFVTGIGSIQYGNARTNSTSGAAWYMRFTPKIAKTSADKLTLTVSFTLARH